MFHWFVSFLLRHSAQRFLPSKMEFVYIWNDGYRMHFVLFVYLNYSFSCYCWLKCWMMVISILASLLNGYSIVSCFDLPLCYPEACVLPVMPPFLLPWRANGDDSHAHTISLWSDLVSKSPAVEQCFRLWRYRVMNHVEVIAINTPPLSLLSW